MSEQENHGHHSDSIHLPAPTTWPVVLAFGLALIFLGIVTNPAISILGGVLTVFGTVGWFRDVLPHERHVDVDVEVMDLNIRSTRERVARMELDKPGRYAPTETYPIVSGIKGGIAGGFAMIIPAMIYGLIAQHSIWYPINLMGGAGIANWTDTSTANIAAFHWQGLIAASVIHAITCLLVGLLYGAMLPMLPRHPIVLGGILAPVLWTGLLHAVMNIVNPVFDQRIQWGWFLISQVTFGLVAGWVVAHQSRISANRNLPLAVRMGIESPGLMQHDHDEKSEDRH